MCNKTSQREPAQEASGKGKEKRGVQGFPKRQTGEPQKKKTMEAFGWERLDKLKWQYKFRVHRWNGKSGP